MKTNISKCIWTACITAVAVWFTMSTASAAQLGQAYISNVTSGANCVQSTVNNAPTGPQFWDIQAGGTYTVTLTGVEFLRRFLQHVLPRGCMKVRYYGIWSPTCRRQLDQARACLTVPLPAPTEPLPITPTPSPAAADPRPMRCPLCRMGILIRVGVLTPQRMRAP